MDLIFSVAAIARRVEDLGLKCHWCGTPLKAKDVDYYEHDGGVLVSDTAPKRAWVYFTCSGCGYQWALWVLAKQVEAMP